MLEKKSYFINVIMHQNKNILFLFYQQIHHIYIFMCNWVLIEKKLILIFSQQINTRNLE